MTGYSEAAPTIAPAFSCFRMSMGRVLTITFLVISAVILVPRSASAYTIRSFDSQMVLSKSGLLTVTETIAVDFDGEQRHGIYRVIPVVYERSGLHYKLRVGVLGVTDGHLNNRPYTLAAEGDKLRLRIGSPNILVTGEQTYVVRYEILRAVNYFSDHDELYIAVNGNFWDETIQRIRTTIDTDFPVDAGRAKSECFTGPYGEALRDCTMDLFYGASGLRFTSETREPARPGEGLTVALWLPQGAVARPSPLLNLIYIFQDNWPFLLPLVVLFAMFWIWLDYGRDQPLPPVSAQYDPPRIPNGKVLRPGEIGVLIDERADMTDITATIVDLAVRGYLRIKEVVTTTLLFFHNKDYEFTLLKKFKADPELSNYEKEILKGIFGGMDAVNSTVSLSSLKNRFYIHLPYITDDLYQEVVDDGLFVGNPNSVRTTWIGIGVVVIVVMAGLAFLFFRSPAAIIPSGVSGLIIIGFAQLMPRKPARGVEEFVEALGFKEFLSRVERDRLERMFKDDPWLFDKYIPYAMVLGVADEWAHQFEGLYTEPPDWYVAPGYARGAFYPRMFVSDLGRGLNTMGSTFASRPSSSAGSGGSAFGGFGGGGGFSGGGFGGKGGGGAW
ncbi:MAG: DUF2207 domain-containing protein [bacterium]